MKNNFMQVAVVTLALLSKSALADEASPNQTSLTGDQKRLQAIELSMNQLHSPCGDFFQYACADWRKSYKAESIHLLDLHVSGEIEGIIKSFRTMKEPTFLPAVYNYYQSCENLQSEDPLGYLRWMNERANVSWPLVVTTAAENNWLELLALTRKCGFNELFFHEDVMQSKDDPLRLAIELKRPAVIALTEFRKNMYNMDDKLSAAAMDKFRQFQAKLLKLTMELIKSEESDDFGFLIKTMTMTSEAEPRLVTLRELQMPWLNKYLSVLLDQGLVDLDMQLYVHSVKYLHRIYEFVSGYDNHFLCNYIQIKFLKYLNDSLRQRGTCVQSTRKLFPLVMQWAYEKHHLELEWETQYIRTLFQNLKRKFKQTLSDNWYEFRPDVVSYLQAKIDKLQLLVGDMSSEDLNQYYEGLNLLPSDYYGNHLKVYNLQFQASHAALSRTLKRHALELLRLRTPEGDQTLNDTLALYNLPHFYPRLNTIFLPVTMLQPPYYEYGMGDLYTYSSIGFLLSLEIVKAFDPRYLQIDADGHYNSVMDEAIRRNWKFQQATQSLWGDFEDEQHNADEVINDLGGLKLAYDTFVEVQPKALQESVNIGEGVMTMDMVFFLNYAHNFCGPVCGKNTMGYFHYDLCERANKPLNHFFKFRQAFGCYSNTEQAQPMWH